MNKYEVKEERWTDKQTTRGKWLQSQNGTFKKKKLLTSKRLLNLHTANFHLGGCEEKTPLQESFNI